MTEPPEIWSERLQVRSYDVDFKRQAALESLCRYFLEAAWNHAEALGFGFSHLARQNRVWVLSRLLVTLKRFPVWGEVMVLNTWPRGTQSVFARRDFEILDPDGTALAAGTSAWLVLDVRTRRPQRLEKFLEPIRSTARQATERDPQKLPALPLSESGGPSGRNSESQPRNPPLDANFAWAVRYSDVDLNGHVNSARYIGRLLDCYTAQWLEGFVPALLEVNYLGEAHQGDALSVHSVQSGPREFLHAILTPEGQETCRARLTWTPVSG